MNRHRLVSATLALSVAGAPWAMALDKARVNYLWHCSGCHQPNGGAVPGTDVPGLKNIGELLDSAEGRSYIVQVPGVADTPLSDAEIADVLNWIVENFNAETAAAGFSRFTADEVTKARQEQLLDPMRARERLIGSTN